MQYIVNQTKQIAIEAETLEEAQLKVLQGGGQVITSNLSASPRPEAKQTQLTSALPRTQ